MAGVAHVDDSIASCSSSQHEQLSYTTGVKWILCTAYAHAWQKCVLLCHSQTLCQSEVAAYSKPTTIYSLYHPGQSRQNVHFQMSAYYASGCILGRMTNTLFSLYSYYRRCNKAGCAQTNKMHLTVEKIEVTADVTEQVQLEQ